MTDHPNPSALEAALDLIPSLPVVKPSNTPGLSTSALPGTTPGPSISTTLKW